MGSRDGWPTVAIVTNDNPRSEDPAAIAAEIMNGIDMEVELDRRRAIELAVARPPGPATSS